MSRESATRILLDGLTFPEAPRWRDGKLWFSDFYSHRVMRLGLDGQAAIVVEVPQRPSGLGWTPDGTLLVVSTLATGPCNDVVVDSAGRAYVGNFGFDRHAGEPERTTCLVRVDPDGSVTRAADDLSFPNGTLITPDGRRLIIAETFTNRLTAFDIGADGALGNRRVFAQLGDCYPDGICLDAGGAIWVADARGNRVVRVFEGGRIERTISTGTQGAFACMLGGEDRRTLFICTSSGSGPAMAKRRDGRIEFVRVDIPGAGLP